MSADESEILKTDALGRVTVPKHKREEMLDAFEQSGMSGAEFARAHGVPTMTFASWIQKRRRARGDYDKEDTRRKLRMRRSKTPQASKKSPQAINLIEVDVSNSTSKQPSSSLEVLLPNGVKIFIASESQIPLVKTLMHELSC
ncbi:IS66 family insertion sequence element accessory protein TnpA [Rubritalea tangerina]|uniref:Transposase n=1 Tax=Rubritalea tangerina TaxID=430798 RepID=A0ABW4ZGG7_9BACT